MNEVFCIIDRERKTPLRKLVETAVSEMWRLDGQRWEVVVDEPGMCLGVVQRNASDQPVHRDGQTLVLHGDMCGGWSALPDRGRLGSEQFIESAPNGFFNLLAWESDKQTLTVFSDLLAVKPLYYWQQGTRVVISSRLKSFRLLPFFSSRPDSRSIAGILILGSTALDQTILEGVKRFLAGVVTVCSPTGMHTRPTGLAGLVSHQPSRPLEDLLEEADSVLLKAASTWTGGHDRVMVSLSGGLDSRMVLGYTMRVTGKVKAATFGALNEDEVVYAGQVTGRAGVEHAVLPMRGDLRLSGEELSEFAWATEWFGDGGGAFFWKPWVELVRREGLPLANGYLGDTLFGKMVGGSLGFTDSEWSAEPDPLGAAMRAFGVTIRAPLAVSQASSKEFLHHLTWSIQEDLATTFMLVPGPSTYQRLTEAILHGRQRGWFPWLGEVSSAATPTLAPYYTPEVLRYFLSLPVDSLRNRKLALGLLLEKFGRLARAPEAGPRLPMVSRNRLQSRLDRAAHALRTHLEWRFPKMRRPDVKDVFQVLRNAHAEVFAEGLRGAHEVLAEHLDLRKVAEVCPKVTAFKESEKISRLYNMATFLKRFFG